MKSLAELKVIRDQLESSVAIRNNENGIHAEKASCVPALQVLCLSL